MYFDHGVHYKQFSGENEHPGRFFGWSKSHKSSRGLRGAFMWTFRPLRCQCYLDVYSVHPTLQ